MERRRILASSTASSTVLSCDRLRAALLLGDDVASTEARGDRAVAVRVAAVEDGAPRNGVGWRDRATVETRRTGSAEAVSEAAAVEDGKDDQPLESRETANETEGDAARGGAAAG